MEKHDLLMMIGGLCGLTMLVFTLPTVYADDSEKDLCKSNDGKWKDGGCVFKEDDGIDKEQNEVNFEHDLADKGMWETSNEREDDNYDYKYKDNDGKDKDDDDYSEAEAWNEKDYESIDKDDLPHSDKSYSDWEYDDEEHPSLR